MEAAGKESRSGAVAGQILSASTALWAYAATTLTDPYAPSKVL